MSEMSDLVVERKECPKCQAVWINGEHYWATGAKGNELDLAGLVCNTGSFPECPNPMRGLGGGDTWEKRRKLMDSMASRMDGLDGPLWDAGISHKDN